MNTSLQTGFLQNQLSKNGFIHLPYPSSKDYRSILDELGAIIQTTEIKENFKSTRLLSSNVSMDFHTDHHSARFIAWLCNSQSVTGGDSLLLDSRPLLNSYSGTFLFLLSQVTVQSHRVFLTDKSSLPLLSLDNDGSPTSIYYAPWLINSVADIKIKMALEKFTKDLQAIKPFEILLSEGDLLIIDNHRMLHGRKSFPTGSGRWLTRFWLS